MEARAGKSKTVDLDTVIPNLSAALTTRGVLKPADLTRAGVPKPQHAEALAALERLGAERTKTGARVDLATQLRALLRDQGVLPIAKLGKALKGATQAEAKRTADRLVTAGEARQALRGKVEVLVTPAADLLTPEQLRRLADAGALAKKAATRPGRSLLREDLRAQLLDILGAGRAPAPASDDLETRVLATLRKAARPGLGLAFVPDVVRELSAAGTPAVHAALLELARGRQVELQPESGVGRLTAEELSLCPEGPQRSRLSWARVLS
jgi:hypothetical protein